MTPLLDVRVDGDRAQHGPVPDQVQQQRREPSPRARLLDGPGASRREHRRRDPDVDEDREERVPDRQQLETDANQALVDSQS